jgi:hypothetical protein
VNVIPTMSLLCTLEGMCLLCKTTFSGQFNMTVLYSVAICLGFRDDYCQARYTVIRQQVKNAGYSTYSCFCFVGSHKCNVKFLYVVDGSWMVI